MAKKNVVVVGGGLFGSIAAALAAERGHSVTVIDSQERYRASPASGCVLAPSWLSALSAEDVKYGMSVLDQLYGLERLEFVTAGMKLFKAHRVDADRVLRKPASVGCTMVTGKVVAIGDGYVKLDSGLKYSGTVLVAAGIWSQALLPDMPPMYGRWGASVRVRHQLDAPRLQVYAPYRQAVVFNMNKHEVWGGDGTALIEKTWFAQEDARKKQTVARVVAAMGAQGLGLSDKAKLTVGVRPFVEGHKEGYFAKFGTKVWVSTGGGKNGTVLAALNAMKFVEAL